MNRPDRDRLLAEVAEVEGWMSPAQGRRLWDAAAAVRRWGTIVEIGSYRGKSAVVLASAADPTVRVIAVDPHAGNDRGPRQIHGAAGEGQADHEAFLANLARFDVGDRVEHVRRFSSAAWAEVLDDESGPIDVLYIDGAHRFGPARDDLVRWGAAIRPGGTMLVHDAYSSVGVTLALMTTTVLGARFRYGGRDGSLTRYRRRDLTLAERPGNALRQLLPLGWFARNLVVKALLVVHLGRPARLLGHDGETWPY